MGRDGSKWGTWKYKNGLPSAGYIKQGRFKYLVEDCVFLAHPCERAVRDHVLNAREVDLAGEALAEIFGLRLRQHL